MPNVGTKLVWNVRPRFKVQDNDPPGTGRTRTLGYCNFGIERDGVISTPRGYFVACDGDASPEQRMELITALLEVVAETLGESLPTDATFES